jgi:hypothetical protein
MMCRFADSGSSSNHLSTLKGALNDMLSLANTKPCDFDNVMQRLLFVAV